MQINMEQLLMMLQNRSSETNEPPKSIKLDKSFLSDHQLQSLPKDVKQIYDHLFDRSPQPIQLEKFLPFQKKTTKVPICNKLFNHREEVFRCFDCSVHEASVFCIGCFQAGNHDGHRFKKITSGGGNCDCGNAMAVKSQGFCKNHSGKAELMEIDAKQKETFIYFFKYLIEWLLQFSQQDKKESDKMGKAILSFLKTLNQQSIYYNSLTFYLFEQKANNSDYKLLHELLFIMTEKLSAKTACSLFFEMFSLEEFKYSLIKEFVSAYNEVDKFEQTGYHSLYIQLFANDDLTTRLCKQTRQVLYPKRQYNLEQILEDINFISSLHTEVALLYYDCYFQATHTIPLPYLDTIEEECQKGEEHIVSMITSHINEENFYYFIMIKLIKTVKHDKKLLTKILKGLYKQINSNKYSYKKNKAILPYHRSFGLTLFAIFNGDIEEISFQSLSEILQDSQKNIENFFQKQSSRVLQCILEFASTYGKQSYFENYSAMYIRRGSIIVINFDYLFIRIVSCLYANSKLDMNQILVNFFENDLIEGDNSSTKPTSEQLISKWVTFLGLAQEIIVSNKIQILFSNKLELSNTAIQADFNTFFVSVCKFASPFSKQSIKILQKHFFGVLKEQVMEKYLNFEKNSKKYNLRSESAIDQLCFKYYVSLFKVSQEIPNSSQKDDRYVPYLSEKNKKVSSAFLLKELVMRIFNLLTDEIKKYAEICQNFREQLDKLRSIQGQAKLQHIYSELLSYEKHGTSKNFSIEEEKNKVSQMKKLKASKLKKMKEKQNNFMRTFSQKEQPIQQVQPLENNDLCMICRQNAENQPLCYLSYLHKTNTFNFYSEEKGQNYFFTSCLHSAHYKCCFKIYGVRQTFFCPLCKSPGNVLLPCSKENFHEKLYNQIANRISTIASINFDNENCKELSDEQNIFFNLLKSFIEMIGLVSIKESSYYEITGKTTVNSLYLLAQNLWNQFDFDERNQLKQVISKYLVQLQSKKQIAPLTSVILNTKHLILSFMLESFFNSQLSLEPYYSKYCEKINYFDTKIILKNLSMCIRPEQPVKQVMDESMINDEIIRIQNCFKYFNPPETIKELIELRQNPKYKCKNGHNVGVCVICQEGKCLECKVMKKHTNQCHSGNCLYLSLLTGGLVYYDWMEKVMLKSLFENKMGQKWSQQKAVQGYMIDIETYQTALKKLSLHSLKRFVQDQEPEYRRHFQMIED